jgi:hypothetical protein
MLRQKMLRRADRKRRFDNEEGIKQVSQIDFGAAHSPEREERRICMKIMLIIYAAAISSGTLISVFVGSFASSPGRRKVSHETSEPKYLHSSDAWPGSIMILSYPECVGRLS